MGGNFKETAGEERTRLDLGPETQGWCWPGEDKQASAVLVTREPKGDEKPQRQGAGVLGQRIERLVFHSIRTPCGSQKGERREVPFMCELWNSSIWVFCVVFLFR